MNKRWKRGDNISRRNFIKQGAGVGASAALLPWVVNLTACDENSESEPSDSRLSNGTDPSKDETSRDLLLPEAVLVGLYSGDGAAAVEAAGAKLDFSWLNSGDTVLIKVASNSGNPHPATTSSGGVQGMVTELKNRGAGRVIVADQAGVEWVRKTAVGRFSSTRDMFQSNGLISVEGDAELHFFDDGDWDSGYFEATLPEGNRWPRGMYIASIIKEVDHIIYMPRISAHMLAGLTNAHKSAIGWLRDDSRHDLHNDARGFYEKYTEINYVEEIRSRFRMVVTVNESVQLFGGPDEGTNYRLDVPLVVASTSIANHDAMAASILVTLQNITGAAPSGTIYNSGTAALLNSFFARGTNVGGISQAGPWSSGSSSTSLVAHTFQTVDGERAVVHGWKLSGGKPSSINAVLDGKEMDAELRSGIESHGSGLYSFT